MVGYTSHESGVTSVTASLFRFLLAMVRQGQLVPTLLCLFYCVLSRARALSLADRMRGNWKGQHPYAPNFSPSVTAKYEESESTTSPTAQLYPATCFCGRVHYEVRGGPMSSKLCHCRGCQLLHGAPFEWVSIFEKEDVRFRPSSLDNLYFYSSELDRGWTAEEAGDRILPVKVSCAHCRTPVADEGRHMWLGFSTLFGFTCEDDECTTIPPPAFQHSCHLFYQQRCIDLPDDKEKWTGHRLKSKKWVPGRNEM
jgi:hypothetical protein